MGSVLLIVLLALAFVALLKIADTFRIFHSRSAKRERQSSTRPGSWRSFTASGGHGVRENPRNERKRAGDAIPRPSMNSWRTWADV